MIYTLLNESGITSANWGGDAVSTRQRNGEALVQTTVRGTATVEIQGRMTSASEWHVIDTATQSDSTVATQIAVFPQMRAVVTSVDVDELATGEISSTCATGSISISENPAGANLDPTLIAILGTDATKAKSLLTYYMTGSNAIEDEDLIVLVTDGAGGTLTFEGASSTTNYESTVAFGSTAVAGDKVTIYDIAGNGRVYFFSAAAGDNPDNTQTEVLLGDGEIDAATNFETAVNADWLAGKIFIEPSRSTTTVTLKQADLRDTGDPLPVDTRVTGAITATSWSGGTEGINLDDASNIPIPVTGTTTGDATNTYTAFQNQVAKGNWNTVTITKESDTEVKVEMKTPGSHHSKDVDVTDGLPLNITGGGATSNDGTLVAYLDITQTAGTDGTEQIKLEINEASEVSGEGYTHIDRVDGEAVETIIKRITTAIAATSWAGGTLTAKSDYNNKSVTLQSAGSGSGSLTNFGNSTIQVVLDPYDIITVTGMSGGATGVTVLCNLDVPQSS